MHVHAALPDLLIQSTIHSLAYVCVDMVLQVARLQWAAMTYRPKMMSKYAVE
jgi:hypothetical protein